MQLLIATWVILHFFFVFQNQHFKKFFQEYLQSVKQPAWIQVRPDVFLAGTNPGFLESGFRCIREGGYFADFTSFNLILCMKVN